jgi:hypothetical protein
LDRGIRELDSFATTTLNQLVRAERNNLGRSTGLELFCRLDVGVIRDSHGELMYWVSEVDRTQNASLFACDALHWTAVLAEEFAEFLPRYLGVAGAS